jgi:hypothetical protein
LLICAAPSSGGCRCRIEVDLDDLADKASAVVVVGNILSKLLKDKNALPRQIMLCRGYMRAVFLGA